MWGLLKRSCLQLWETWSPAFIAGTVTEPVALWLSDCRNVGHCCLRDKLLSACGLYFRILCNRLCLSQHHFFLSSLQPFKQLSDITDGHLKECLYQHFPSPLFYQVLRVKHMLKYFTGSRPILTHINPSGTTGSGQEVMGQCSPEKYINCH